MKGSMDRSTRPKTAPPRIPIFQPLLMASQKMGTIPRLMEPPWGRLKKLWLIRLNAPARETSTAVSASILLEKNWDLLVWFSLLSLRQYYLVQVLWVDSTLSCPLSRVEFSQLPEYLEGDSVIYPYFNFP